MTPQTSVPCTLIMFIRGIHPYSLAATFCCLKLKIGKAFPTKLGAPIWDSLRFSYSILEILQDQPNLCAVSSWKI